MALIRQLLILTFDTGDSFNDKTAWRELFEKQGYHVISEVKVAENGVVKEWMMQGTVQMGKLNPDIKNAVVKQPQQQGAKPEEAQKEEFNRLIHFDPRGGV